jgi:hypothetical protein
MLFSGELSMTTSALLLPLVADLDELVDPPPPADEPLPDEQAARLAARSPAAPSASALLLVITLIFN